jgi:hypothetical protein
MGALMTTAMGINYFRTNAPFLFVSFRKSCSCFFHHIETLLQSWKSARDYCCSLGMRLATFPNFTHMEDAYNTVGYRML